jgi:stearoyl-CoA desaturase (delta-9 desaturase)
LAHVHGTQRYLTGDESRNNWLLAVIALGEGWHNNHHASPISVRQGFEWWEFDFTYYLLVALRKAGLVWGFRLPPASRAANERSPGAAILNRAARQLVRSFWGKHNVRTSLASSFAQDSPGAAPNREVLAHVPTRDQLHQCAAALFPKSPAIEEVVDRAYSMLTDPGREEGYDSALGKSN